jgi:sortase A
LHKTVVEGTSREALRSGPGHYRSTPRPGRAGNAAIAGHRTTHGAPFFDLDQLQPGDEIVVETVEGRFSYLVEGHDDGAGGEVGHLIVEPDDVSVIADRGDNRLTLTACHPTYSARQRIVVSAVLHGLPVGVAPSIAEIRPAVATARAEAEAEVAGAVSATGTGPFSHGDTEPSTTAEASIDTGGGSDAGAGTIDSGLGWQTEHAGITLRWAAFTALIAGMAQLAARLWRRWPAYAVASPAFGLALFTCFTHLDRLIPAA